MNYEEKILEILVENYRKSKKDSGDNKTNRRTQIKPEKIYKKYNANDGNLDEISKLNESVTALIEKGFVMSVHEKFGTQIQCIYLIDEKINNIEKYLNKKYGYISKDMQITKMYNLIERYKNASPICKAECIILDEGITNRKVPKNIDSLEDIFKAISFIENNKETLYIKEVSMKVYGDSKYFGNKLLEDVCMMLRKYANRTMNEFELVDEILLDYHIYKEPQKLCIKGNAVICISGKEVDISGFFEGIEILVSDLANIETVKILAPKFMTIENRTSYLRYRADDMVIFYLGGYANRYQRDFIRLIYRTNLDVKYMHFGDIDAGGFWIHNNLCKITGVDFTMFHMSIEELKNSEYKKCLHKLTENDVARLQELKEIELYSKTVNYMLEHSVKLEQEIISLSLINNIMI